ncbi:hypothetical protein Gohar_024371 [Gossypium harknessii]|uniref:Tetratricopeptide repeat-like superfamily protein n=1 Tax=Gossypium harknessii TaxID=34285 RepID=A0A7J9HFP0_9ROSI|nr:hypothetical protein [Gossypium harknessii]
MDRSSFTSLYNSRYIIHVPRPKRHFVVVTQLLAQARSSANSLAKQAESEADKAVFLDPKDAAPYTLKAFAVDLQGFKTSALHSLNVALSPLTAKSNRVNSIIDDLTEGVELSSDNVKVFCLLGKCYEMKKMKSEAKAAFKEALKTEPSSYVARAALHRLRR